MKTKGILTAVVILVLSVSQSPAQPLATRSFDLLFQGDDPSERYDFLLPLDPQTPVVAQFTGFLENLASEETGVRYGVNWYLGNTLWDGRQFTDDMGVRLPGADPLLGTIRVPISFHQPIDFTPSEIHFWVEGIGGADNFRFNGDFAIQPVPEPTVSVLFVAAVLAVGARWLRRRAEN